MADPQTLVDHMNQTKVMKDQAGLTRLWFYFWSPMVVSFRD